MLNFCFKNKTRFKELTLDGHISELQKLKENDPTFFKFLQKHDPELLDFHDGLMAENDDGQSQAQETPVATSKEKITVTNELLDILEESALGKVFYFATFLLI